MVQRPIPVISFKIFLTKLYRDVTSKKVSGRQNQQTAILLDYYYWNKVKPKVNEGRLNILFKSEEEVISKIKSVWKKCASNMLEIRKSMKTFLGRFSRHFPPFPIKMHSG